METLQKSIATLESFVENPTEGLGDEIFHLVSRLTPMVNVDLLIKNDASEILLTWRCDQFYGPGWHIPGGVLRFKESLENRIDAVALSELSTKVKYAAEPIRVQQVFSTERDTRGHYISFLYECELLGSLDDDKRINLQNPRNDQWAWHRTMPDNLIEVHKRIYGWVFR